MCYELDVFSSPEVSKQEAWSSMWWCRRMVDLVEMGPGRRRLDHRCVP